MQSKLTKSDALDIFRDIEIGRGRIAALVARKPWLSELSRRWLFGAAGGGPQSLFRAVSPVDGLHADKAVSTTTDVKVAFDIAAEFPMLLGADRTITPKPTILRYDAWPERVLADVPTLYAMALEVVGGGQGVGITDRHGGRLSVLKLTTIVAAEREVVYDAEGMSPAVLELAPGWFGKLVTSDVVSGRFVDGRDFVERHNAVSSMKMSMDSAVESDAEAERVRSFLTPSQLEPAGYIAAL